VGVIRFGDVQDHINGAIGGKFAGFKIECAFRNQRTGRRVLRRGVRARRGGRPVRIAMRVSGDQRRNLAEISVRESKFRSKTSGKEWLRQKC